MKTLKTTVAVLHCGDLNPCPECGSYHLFINGPEAGQILCMDCGRQATATGDWRSLVEAWNE